MQDTIESGYYRGFAKPVLLIVYDRELQSFLYRIFPVDHPDRAFASQCHGLTIDEFKNDFVDRILSRNAGMKPFMNTVDISIPVKVSHFVI